MQAIYNEPAFRRMYWRALGELVNGPLDIAKSGPLLDAKYEAFRANGLNVENPNSSLKNWVTSARTSIASQMASENVSSFTVNSTVTVSNDVAYVTGTAPFNIKSIWVNGGEYPLVWTSRTTFSVAVPVQPGTNRLSVVGVDMQNQPVVGASNNVAAVYVGTLPSMVEKWSSMRSCIIPPFRARSTWNSTTIQPPSPSTSPVMNFVGWGIPSHPAP
jgi:hypothetical protein